MKVVMIDGSANDRGYMQIGREYLDQQGIAYEEEVLSAHRDMPELMEFLYALNRSGEKAVTVATAGFSAALPGLVAVRAGIDALLAMCRVPGQVPLGRVGLHSKAPPKAVMFAQREWKLGGQD